MAKIEVEIQLESLVCGACSIPFAIPVALHRDLQVTGRDFWCPNGCCIRYAETTVQRLQKQLAEAQEIANAARARERDALALVTASSAETKRLRRRIKAGVCPFCKRSFRNVQCHMACKHPEEAQHE